jgi:hypothetical protein
MELSFSTVSSHFYYYYQRSLKGSDDGVSCPGLRLAQPGGPAARVSVILFLPEDGRRSSFRNVVILLKYRQWTKSKKTLLQIITIIIIISMIMFRPIINSYHLQKHDFIYLPVLYLKTLSVAQSVGL